MGFLRMVEPERWRDPIDPEHLWAPAWASCVFAGSETSVALLTSPPGLEGDAVIDIVCALQGLAGPFPSLVPAAASPRGAMLLVW
jgi:hypothetical protein